MVLGKSLKYWTFKHKPELMVNKSILDESAFSGGQTKLYKRPTSLKPGNVSRLFFYSEMTSIERLLNGLCVYHGLNWELLICFTMKARLASLNYFKLEKVHYQWLPRKCLRLLSLIVIIQLKKMSGEWKRDCRLCGEGLWLTNSEKCNLSLFRLCRGQICQK